MGQGGGASEMQINGLRHRHLPLGGGETALPKSVKRMENNRAQQKEQKIGHKKRKQPFAQF